LEGKGKGILPKLHRKEEFTRGRRHGAGLDLADQRPKQGASTGTFRRKLRASTPKGTTTEDDPSSSAFPKRP